ncbi:hypothetical protein [Bradyrhizobium sp. JYMT SZCCT0428]|uniref:hypothetical protein n=1 Tax=Bradyrhizobium sp. JYMT SZCCT0428 TaxID=2807673 RepID=UPI001BA8EBCE|nr:hypothetical protein [Bradyrhizobium sp. JYMT SZCCT0428]MBR1157449.1 hypothetical protein [Bradyrhizobium sp. JYMT SZCCT0428]
MSLFVTFRTCRDFGVEFASGIEPKLISSLPRAAFGAKRTFAKTVKSAKCYDDVGCAQARLKLRAKSAEGVAASVLQRDRRGFGMTKAIEA